MEKQSNSDDVRVGINDWSISFTAAVGLSAVLFGAGFAMLVWLHPFARHHHVLPSVVLTVLGVVAAAMTYGLEGPTFIRSAAKAVASFCIVIVGASAISAAMVDKYSFVETLNTFLKYPNLAFPVGLVAFCLGYFYSHRTMEGRVEAIQRRAKEQTAELSQKLQELEWSSRKASEESGKLLWKRERKIESQGEVISELRRVLRNLGGPGPEGGAAMVVRLDPDETDG